MKVKIIGFQDNFERISFFRLIKEKGQLSAIQAKAFLEDLIEGNTLELEISLELAESFITEAKKFGLKVESNI